MWFIISDGGEKVKGFLEILANFPTNIAGVLRLRLVGAHTPEVAAAAPESPDTVTGAEEAIIREVDAVVRHACIIPEVSRVVQRKLEKSCEFVQEQDAQTKTDELEHFEDELRFLHAFIISHHCRIASTKKVFLLSCCKCLRNKGLQQFVGKYRVIGTPTGVLRTYR